MDLLLKCEACERSNLGSPHLAFIKDADGKVFCSDHWNPARNMTAEKTAQPRTVMISVAIHLAAVVKVVLNPDGPNLIGTVHEPKRSQFVVALGGFPEDSNREEIAHAVLHYMHSEALEKIESDAGVSGETIVVNDGGAKA